MSAMNDQRIAQWLKFKPYMWNLPAGANNLNEEQVQKAVLGYLLRELSRGRVPLLDPLIQFLEGKTPLPSCGFIGCFMDSQCGDHVH